MKLLVFIAILFITVGGYGQHQKQPKLNDMGKDLQKMQQQTDSSIKALDSLNAHLNDGYKKTMDSVYNHLETEQNNRNMDMFLQMQREQQAKQKKEALLRIGLGVLFLGVLVFGLMRRRKKSAEK
jgi:parvulin-like peptidyl-prolyl isomerase